MSPDKPDLQAAVNAAGAVGVCVCVQSCVERSRGRVWAERRPRAGASRAPTPNLLHVPSRRHRCRAATGTWWQLSVGWMVGLNERLEVEGHRWTPLKLRQDSVSRAAVVSDIGAAATAAPQVRAIPRSRVRDIQKAPIARGRSQIAGMRGQLLECGSLDLSAADVGALAAGATWVHSWVGFGRSASLADPVCSTSGCWLRGRPRCVLGRILVLNAATTPVLRRRRRNLHATIRQ